ncbi:MAG: hypothetical protein J6X25_02030 [Bacteroidales bacterium]|nr:hypothetical protein [Bacteroidales bacterium]
MKKIFTLAAVAALVLASCAKIETIERNVDEPIAFAGYAGNPLTKAGAYGEETTTSLQTNGFGVFAYQTTGAYSASATPNFMYNTKVSTSSWTYSPIKYWPNQIQAGNTDSQPATAFQADKVSFFAYAPHVAATASTGAVTGGTDEGITALTSNATAGDPKVTYKVSADLDKQVDLLWAVSKGETWTNVAGTTNTPTSGMPYLNLQKPAIGTAIHFYFKHALAQITLTAQAAYNQAAAGGTAQDGVKITIKQVELSVPGMTQTAVLNLNNTTADTPLWESASGSTNLALTVSGSNINSALLDGGDVAPASQPAGVTAAVQPVIVNGKYYTVIPTATSTNVTVKVTYYVSTPDADLAKGYSRVENVISKSVSFASGFAAGTKNTINMILGISEVVFEASVDPWVDGTSADVNLPLN